MPNHRELPPPLFRATDRPQEGLTLVVSSERKLNCCLQSQEMLERNGVSEVMR